MITFFHYPIGSILLTIPRARVAGTCRLYAALVLTAGGLLNLSDPASASEGAAELAALPPNQWVAFSRADVDWRRQGHGGAAYDSKRGTLLLFGSNTHGENWDNSVHEFDPATKRWTTHYAPAAPGTYRAGEGGLRIAGPDDHPLPWAMHTYDAVLYDPSLDALVVPAQDPHNPIAGKVPDATVNPTWVYDLETQEWRPLGEGRQSRLAVFAGAAAYDSDRDTLVVYGGNGSPVSGMFELGPDRKQWKQVGSPQHEIHFNMEYDPHRKLLAVFGDYADNKRTIWLFRPNPTPGRFGKWEERDPGGDECPRSQTSPVAYDLKAHVFLIVPKGVTCVYDPDENAYTRLPGAKIPPLEEPYNMNFNMVYDARHGVFLLVTGEWKAPPVVWALRLDLGAL
jgi:hypothetical protein